MSAECLGKVSHTTYTPTLIHEMCTGNFLVHYMNSNQATDYSRPLPDDTYSCLARFLQNSCLYLFGLVLSQKSIQNLILVLSSKKLAPARQEKQYSTTVFTRQQCKFSILVVIAVFFQMSKRQYGIHAMAYSLKKKRDQRGQTPCASEDNLKRPCIKHTT